MPSNKLHTELLISAGVEGLNHIDRVIDRLRAAGEDTEQLAEESARLRREWDDLDPQQQAERMRNLGEATNQASDDAANLADNTERNVGIFGRLHTAVVALGVALGGAFVVGKIKAFFTDAVAGASGFESQMATVKAVSGATAEEMEKLRATAEKMGSETRYTATEAAQGLEILARAGLDANESINTLPYVLSLAQGNSLELADAAGYITQAVNGMGMSMDEAGRVADVLAKAAASANTDIQGMGYALSEAAPLASSLGLTIEETAAYIGKLADAGIDGSKGGTALKEMMVQFQNPASTFKRELAEIGIRTNDFNQAIRQLVAAGPKGEAAITALGTSAGPAFRALVGQGIDSLDELKGKLDDAGGTAAQQAAEMDNTLAGAFASLQSAWDSLKQKLATPVLEPLAKKMRELGDVVRGLVDSGKIAALGERIATMFSNGADAAIKFVQEFDFGWLIDKISAGFEALSTVGRGVNGAFQALNIGVQAVKSGLAALGGILATVAEGWVRIAEGIVSGASWIADKLGADGLAGSLDKVSESLSKTADAAADFRGAMIEASVDASESMASSVRSIAGVAEESTDQAAASFAKIPAAAEDAAAKSTNPMIAMYQMVVDKVIEVTDTAKKEAEKQAKAAEEAAERTKEAQEKAAVAAKDAFAGFGVDLDEVLTGVSAKAKKAMGDYTHAVQQATDAGLDATKAARAGFEALAEKMESPQEWAAFKQHLIDSGQGLDHLTKNQLKRIEDNIKGLPDVAATAMQQLKQKFETASLGDLSRLKNEAKAAFEGGEISGKQYAQILEDIQLKTEYLSSVSSSYGDTAAQAHDKATAAAKEEAAAKRELAEAQKEGADASKKNAEATSQATSISFRMYDATNLNAEALKKLNDMVKEWSDGINSALIRGADTRRWNDFGRQIAIHADQLRDAQAAIDGLNESTSAGTVTMNDIADVTVKAQGVFYGLDSITLNNLNAAIDAARKKLADMRQEAEDTRASLEAQLASLRGDDSVARALDEQKRLRELNLKLQEAEAKGQQEIAAEYRRAIELQKQVFDEERRQAQQRKADEAKRKQEAEQRKSGTSSNNSASGGKGISTDDLVGAWDERIDAARKAGRDDLARELYQAAKRRPR